MMNVLDLCSGTGAATIAFRERGHRVVTVDCSTELGCPDILADVRHLPIIVPPGGWDLIWASPPCREFTASGLAFHPLYKKQPSLEIVLACLVAIRDLNPRWWVLENVRNSVPWLRPHLGEPFRAGSWMLWGDFPPIHPGKPVKNLRKLWSHQKKKRNAVARVISDELCAACENTLGMIP